MDLDLDNLPSDWLYQLASDIERRLAYCIGK